ETGGIGRHDRPRGNERANTSKNLPFALEILVRRLDNQIGILRVSGKLGVGGNVGERPRRLGRCDQALVHEKGQVATDSLDGPLEALVVEIVQDYVITPERE